MPLIIKSDLIKWLRYGVRIPKTVLKIEIGHTVHDLWDSRICVNT